MNDFIPASGGKNIDSINRQRLPSQKPPIVHVSLLSTDKKSHPGRRILKITLAVVSLVIVILGSVVVSRAVDLSNKIFVGHKTSFFQRIKEVLEGSSGQVRLVGEDLGQINVLLLGIGGEGHDGPYLTDTMILAQIRPDTGQVVLTSIPRDYWSAMPKGAGFAKINAAFSDGYVKNHDWNEGGTWAVQAVEDLSGLNIPYFAVVDFAGFEKAVNQINGLDIKIDRTFTDYQYPNSGTGFLPPQTFTAGWEHMDGSRALIFARSRHAAGPEGSDFSRSSRQQKVIAAFKEKLINLNLITDAGKINSLLGTFADHFHTNITPGEVFRIYTLIRDKNISSFLSLSLDPSTNLICPEIMPDTGAYILAPCQGKTEADIKNFFKNAFAIGKLNQEKSVIWLSVSNGDSTAYQETDRALKDAGLTVWELPYKGDQLPQNIFYQVNPKPATTEFIKNTFSAAEATLPPPGIKIDNGKVDIIIILGGAKKPQIREQQ